MPGIQMMLRINQLPIDVKFLLELPNIPDVVRRSIAGVFPDFGRQPHDQLWLTYKIRSLLLFQLSLALVSLDNFFVVQILLL